MKILKMLAAVAVLSFSACSKDSGGSGGTPTIPNPEINPVCYQIDCAAPPQGCNYINPTFDQNNCMTSCGTLSCGGEPTPTPTATPNPSATPGPTATPSGTPFLIQWKSIKREVSPKGTFGFDMRTWISQAIVTSSDRNISISELDTSKLASYSKIYDGSGRWIGITNAVLASPKPDSETQMPIVIRNEGGATRATKIRVVVIKPFVRFSYNLEGFKIRKPAGKLVFDMRSLYRRDIIKSSSEAVLMGRHRTNLPLTNCANLSDAIGVYGMACDKGELKAGVKYEINLEITIPEGASDRQLFSVKPINAEEAALGVEDVETIDP